MKVRHVPKAKDDLMINPVPSTSAEKQDIEKKEEKSADEKPRTSLSVILMIASKMFRTFSKVLNSIRPRRRKLKIKLRYLNQIRMR